MSSLKNTIKWQKRLQVKKQNAINRRNINSVRKYNNLIHKYDRLIKKKQEQKNQATLAQLERDAADAVNAIQAKNKLSPAMKQQLNEFEKHAYTAKKINNVLAHPFNTFGTRRRRRSQRNNRTTRNNNNNNRGKSNNTCKERTKNGVCILSGAATGTAVGASIGAVPGACIGAACGTIAGVGAAVGRRFLGGNRTRKRSNRRRKRRKTKKKRHKKN